MTPERVFFGIIMGVFAVLATAIVVALSQFLTPTETIAVVVLWTSGIALSWMVTAGHSEVPR